MSMELAIANVLEKLAVYVEAADAEKNAAVQAERKKLVTAVQEKLATTTGEELSAEVLSKLAEADPAVLAAFSKVAETPDTELGVPSGKKTASAPMDKNEAVEEAGGKLVDFCVS